MRKDYSALWFLKAVISSSSLRICSCCSRWWWLAAFWMCRDLQVYL